MDTTQAENLRILIRHMESKPDHELLMPVISRPCGAPACAMGEAIDAKIGGLSFSPTREIMLRGQYTFMTTAAIAVFGVDFGDKGIHLFGLTINGNQRPSAAEWAQEARQVLAKHGYSMDEAKLIPSVAERLEAIYAAPLDEKPEHYGPVTHSDLIDAALRNLNR